MDELSKLNRKLTILILLLVACVLYISTLTYLFFHRRPIFNQGNSYTSITYLSPKESPQSLELPTSTFPDLITNIVPSPQQPDTIIQTQTVPLVVLAIPPDNNPKPYKYDLRVESSDGP